MKRSPMPQRTQPIRRVVSWRPSDDARRRGWLRAVSAKRQAVNRERRKVIEALLTERGPGCEARLDGCDGRAVDCHEVLRRSQGGSLTDPGNLLLLCRTHHDWITTHPAEAVALGLSRWSWQRDDAT